MRPPTRPGTAPDPRRGLGDMYYVMNRRNQREDIFRADKAAKGSCLNRSCPRSTRPGHFGKHPLTPSLRTETVVGRELILVFRPEHGRVWSVPPACALAPLARFPIPPHPRKPRGRSGHKKREPALPNTRPRLKRCQAASGVLHRADRLRAWRAGPFMCRHVHSPAAYESRRPAPIAAHR